MLVIQSLSCRRGGRHIFRDISLRIEPGGFVMISGPNGSGKSSLLRIVAGLLPAISGDIFWQNQDGSKQSDYTHQGLHYIGHGDALKPELTPHEMLDYWRALRGCTKKNNSDCLKTFDLLHVAYRQICTLSAGQKRRLSLARLVLDPAPLWLLDEPTTALDCAGQELLWEQVKHYRQSGGIVLAALHDQFNIPHAQYLEMHGL